MQSVEDLRTIMMMMGMMKMMPTPPRSCPSWPSGRGSRLPSPWGGSHGSSDDNHGNADYNAEDDINEISNIYVYCCVSLEQSNTRLCDDSFCCLPWKAAQKKGEEDFADHLPPPLPL